MLSVLSNDRKMKLIRRVRTCAFIAMVLIGRAYGKDVSALPLSQANMDGVKKFVDDEGIMTVTELVYRLPVIMRSNYVLIEKSRSRQPSVSPEFPRMILYLPTGDFFVGISTDPKQPNSDDVEMLQFVEGQGWRMGAITLGGDKADYVNGVPIHTGSVQTRGTCFGCHGSPPRPIWGAYPTWEGAFGERLTGPQAAALTRVWTDPKHSNQRLRALIRPTDTLAAEDVLSLPGKKRPYANESLNHVVGNRQSYHLWNKINQHPKADLLTITLLAIGRDVEPYLAPDVVRDLRQYIGTEWNRSPSRAAYPDANEEDWPFLLSGIDPKLDLMLDRTIPECNAATAPQYGFAGWNVTSVYMTDIISVQTVRKLRDIPLTPIREVLGLEVYPLKYPRQNPPEVVSAGNFLSFWYESILERDSQRLDTFLGDNVFPMLNLRREYMLSPTIVKGISEAVNQHASRLLAEETTRRVQRVQGEYRIESK